ncbi:MAG: hypothetical protein AB1298_06895 [Bacteroidota bacterium]
MYAINHAATALLLKKKFPAAGMIWLLIAVQFIELLWVIFNYAGLEFFTVENSKVHLGYLAWSHSILSTVVLAVLVWFVISIGFKKQSLGIAIGLGILSHIVLDLLLHEPDIQLTPFSTALTFGLNIQSIPLLAIIVETGYGIFCWWYFKGSRLLLSAIVILNLLNIPTIFNLMPGLMDLFGRMHFLLPTVIFVQILYTWFFIWLLGKKPSEKTAR